MRTGARLWQSPCLEFPSEGPWVWLSGRALASNVQGTYFHTQHHRKTGVGADPRVLGLSGLPWAFWPCGSFLRWNARRWHMSISSRNSWDWGFHGEGSQSHLLKPQEGDKQLISGKRDVLGLLSFCHPRKTNENSYKAKEQTQKPFEIFLCCQ